MTEKFCVGEKVKHNKRVNWGIGKIVAIERGNTIRVVFEGNRNVSIVKAAKYLTKIS